MDTPASIVPKTVFSPSGKYVNLLLRDYQTDKRQNAVSLLGKSKSDIHLLIPGLRDSWRSLTSNAPYTDLSIKHITKYDYLTIPAKIFNQLTPDNVLKVELPFTIYYFNVDRSDLSRL